MTPLTTIGPLWKREIRPSGAEQTTCRFATVLFEICVLEAKRFDVTVSL